MLKINVLMNILRRWTIGCSLLCLCLIGCSPSADETDLHTYIEQLKKNVHPNVHLLERFVLRTPYYLSDTQLKNPFPKSNTLDAAALLMKSPLQRYSLDVLKLLGIIQDNGQISAIIMTPDGKIFPLVQGDFIGNQQGQVIDINANSVVIRQVAENNTAQRVVLYLKASSATI